MHGWELFPFFMVSTDGGREPRPPQVNVTRLMEAVIIATVTGGIVTWGMTGKLDERLIASDKRLANIEAEQVRLREAQERIKDQMFETLLALDRAGTNTKGGTP